MIRVPDDGRFELRFNGWCKRNPYLSQAAVIAAGLDGVKKQT